MGVFMKPEFGSWLIFDDRCDGGQAVNDHIITNLQEIVTFTLEIRGHQIDRNTPFGLGMPTPNELNFIMGQEV